MQQVGYGALCFWVFSLIAPPAALAYLDPGSGSMLLQLVLGGLAGLAVIAKLYWHRLLGLFAAIPARRRAIRTRRRLPSPPRTPLTSRSRFKETKQLSVLFAHPDPYQHGSLSL